MNIDENNPPENPREDVNILPKNSRQVFGCLKKEYVFL